MSSYDSSSNISEIDTHEAPKCQQCYESLNPQDFAKNPYGYLAAVVKTKLYHHSCKQTFNKQKELDYSLANTEENKKNIENLTFDKK